MKISEITADIEYITPKSAKGCPDGWTLEQTAGKLAANTDTSKRIVNPGYTFPGRESTNIDTHPTVPQVDWTSLKKELDKGIKPVPLKGKIEILTDK